MLTGCRRSEILTLHWDHVDLEAGELCLPDSKTGAKTVHLGDPAIAVLRAIPRRAGDPFVIAGSAPGRPMKDLHHYWQRIRRRVGLKGVRIHNLRRPFAFDDCTTRHNLGAPSRERAREIGTAIRAASAIVDRIVASQQCRRHEMTRFLGLGPVEYLPALNSFFWNPWRGRPLCPLRTYDARRSS